MEVKSLKDNVKILLKTTNESYTNFLFDRSKLNQDKEKILSLLKQVVNDINILHENIIVNDYYFKIDKYSCWDIVNEIENIYQKIFSIYKYISYLIQEDMFKANFKNQVILQFYDPIIDNGKEIVESLLRLEEMEFKNE